MTLKDLETRKAALLAEVEAFKSQLEAEGADLKAISDKAAMDAFKSQLEAQEADLKAISEKVEKNSAKITELNSQIATLRPLIREAARKRPR
jgi:cell division protein FtsB